MGDLAMDGYRAGYVGPTDLLKIFSGAFNPAVVTELEHPGAAATAERFAPKVVEQPSRQQTATK